MSPAVRRAASVAVVIALAIGAALGAWLWGSGRLSDERKSMLEAEEKARNFLVSVREQRERRDALLAGVQSYVDRTLGPDLATVDSALRARLNRIGEAERLKNLSVSTAGSTTRDSPAKSVFSRSEEQRALRNEIDFVEVEGVISGECTLEQAVRLVSRIQSEPWIKRLGEVRLDAVRDGDRVRCTVRVNTLFLPGRSPSGTVEPQPWSPEALVAVAPILEQNPFTLPPKEKPAVASAPPPAPPPPPPAPPPFPYEEWQVTGIVQGPLGREVWLRNGRTGETRLLTAGDALEKAVLVAASGERAEFRIGDERFAVLLGGTLSERHPAP